MQKRYFLFIPSETVLTLEHKKNRRPLASVVKGESCCFHYRLSNKKGLRICLCWVLWPKISGIGTRSPCCTDTGVPRRRAKDGANRKVARECHATWHGRAMASFSAALFWRLGFGVGGVFFWRLGFFPGGKTLLFRPHIKGVKPRF